MMANEPDRQMTPAKQYWSFTTQDTTYWNYCCQTMKDKIIKHNNGKKMNHETQRSEEKQSVDYFLGALRRNK